MPKTIEELRKIINEQEAALLIREQQQALSTMERQLLDRLKSRLADEEGMDETPSVDILQQMYKKPDVVFQLKSVKDANIIKIFEDFAKEFGAENIKNDCMCFPDNTKANAFFQSQAEKGKAFLFQQVNCDNYAFSDGKGHYKMGSKAEIISYCKQNSLAAPFEKEKPVEEEENIESSTLRR